MFHVGDALKTKRTEFCLADVAKPSFVKNLPNHPFSDDAVLVHKSIVILTVLLKKPQLLPRDPTCH
jgi:hypothetical protein